MTKNNFESMTDQELRDYILTNQNDQEAFYIFADFYY